MSEPKPFTTTLESFIEEPVAVGTFAVESVGRFCSDFLWEGPGLYCLLKDDVRVVGTAEVLGDTLEARVQEDPWFTHGVAFTLTEGAWTEGQIAYLEDRLVHMFDLENFRLEPRAQRDHTGMAQADRLAATKDLLTALRLLEEAGYELFRKVEGTKPQDTSGLTMSLEAAVEGRSLTDS